MLLGERLAEVRDLAGISTRELDRLAGITQGHTSNIERSKTGNVELKTLDKVAQVLGVTLDYLVRGDGEKPTREQVQAAVAAARPKTDPPPPPEEAPPKSSPRASDAPELDASGTDPFIGGRS